MPIFLPDTFFAEAEAEICEIEQFCEKNGCLNDPQMIMRITALEQRFCRIYAEVLAHLLSAHILRCPFCQGRLRFHSGFERPVSFGLFEICLKGNRVCCTECRKTQRVLPAMAVCRFRMCTQQASSILKAARAGQSIARAAAEIFADERSARRFMYSFRKTAGNALGRICTFTDLFRGLSAFQHNYLKCISKFSGCFLFLFL